jgi:hypothetical protein
MVRSGAQFYLASKAAARHAFPKGVAAGTAVTPVPSGHFPHHVSGFLVPAQALEPGMAQLPVRRPFGETDLGDEPGFHPVHR